MEKTIGFVGLGKMGAPMVERLRERGFSVETFDVGGGGTRGSIGSLVESLESPRRIFLMVPHAVVGDVVREVAGFLREGDTIFDGGNSYFKTTIELADECKAGGIHFFDVGISGGPSGARNGACLMVGGESGEFEEHEDIFSALSVEGGYRYVGDHGAGHFVKMVHNGIEYGMMQAIAEGFAVMKASEFSLNLREIADLFTHGSVVDSKLVALLPDGFSEFGEDLSEVSGSVSQNGAGAWTSLTAEELEVETPVITASVEFRKESEENPSFTGKVLTMLRNRFGGHSVTVFNKTL